TKDIASQGVKKDVSSLRYIALPNWFHEAHMESSNNNALDACNADAPKSNGISNPTATSKSPPADQIETLIVESAIPTVSSSVPTACLDNSPETSSDTRLISKGSAQSKPLSKKEQREFYMSVLRSHAGWKTKHFREEAERSKRKGLKLEQGSAKKLKTSEEVSKEDLKEMMQLVPVEEVYVEALQVKHPIIDWEIHSEGQRDYWKIIWLGGHIAVYQFFVDMLKQLDREDLNQLWALVKETLCNAPLRKEDVMS
nr:hypothetical protein [Tanacetum cinerariifolium]